MGSLQLTRATINRERLGDSIRQRQTHMQYMKEIGFPPITCKAVERSYNRKIMAIIAELGGLAGEW